MCHPAIKSWDDVQRKLKKSKTQRGVYFMSIRLSFKSGLSWLLTAATVRHYGITDNYHSDITFVADNFFDVTTLLERAACLQWQDSVQQLQWLHGYIDQVAYQGQKGHEYYYQLQSPLHKLHYRQHHRVFVEKSRKEIIQTILEQAGWFAGIDFNIKLRQHYDIPTLVAQYNETDKVFLLRLLSQWRWHYHFLQSQQRAQLLIYDDIELCDSTTIKLPFCYPSQQLSYSDSISTIATQATWLPTQIELLGYNDREPNVDLHLISPQEVAAATQLRLQYCDANYTTLTAGRQQLHRLQQQLNCQRLFYVACTDCKVLQPGDILQLYDHPLPHYNQCYRVIHITYDITATWQTHLTLLSITQTYFAPAILHSPIPVCLTAHIESAMENTAYLDEYGYYRLRFSFDDHETAELLASPPTRLVQPFLGKQCGQHFPLMANTEVVIIFLFGDWQHPVILAALPNPLTPSPVTERNATQHIVRTPADNALIFEDGQHNQYIELHAQQQNYLRLQATPLAKIEWVTQQGKLNLYAGKNIQIASQDNYTVTCQSQRVRIAGEHTLHSKSITVQAGRDMQWYAKQNLMMKTVSSAISWHIGKDFYFHCEQDYQQHCENFIINVQQGSAKFIAKAIQFQSMQGEMMLGNQQGKIMIKEGSVYIQGRRIILEAPLISVRELGEIN